MKFILWLVLALLSLNTVAETHQIKVYENRFEPEVLSVQSGDSVQWLVISGTHQITAADNDQGVSFNSTVLVPESQFTALLSGEGGAILYSSSAEADMQGALVIETPVNDFVIDERINATYHNPITPGQGLLFEYVPATNFLIAYWFTYNKADGQQQWLIATGTPEANQATLTVLKPTGGKFNDSQAVTNRSWGELTVVFKSCYQAMAYFNASEEKHSGEFIADRIYSAGPCENEVNYD